MADKLLLEYPTKILLEDGSSAILLESGSLLLDEASASLATDAFLLEDGTGDILLEGSVPIPVITLQSETKLKISDETGFTMSTVTFRADQDCDQWEARADGSGTVGSGLLVGSGGAITANSDVQFDVDYTELTNGDKVYVIDVFAHTSGGWSSRL